MVSNYLAVFLLGIALCGCGIEPQGESHRISDPTWVLENENSSAEVWRALDEKCSINDKPRGGFVITPMGKGAAVARASVLQSDGKFILSGYAMQENFDFGLLRYNSDGSLDTTFATNGVLTDSLGTSSDTFYSMALQTDGKIWAAGTTIIAQTQFAVARYNTDGSLDTSFNSTGKLSAFFNTNTSVIYAVGVQTDGKLVAAGYTSNSNSDFALARFHTDGTLDTAFNSTGKLWTSINTSADIAYALSIQSDGSLIAGGYSTNQNIDFALARYRTNGTLDTSFRTNGKVMTSMNTSSDILYALQIQSDGRVIAGGYSSNTNIDYALARYHTNGTLDTSFRTNGKTMTSINTSSDVVHALQIQSDGKIVASGYSTNTNTDFSMARYNSNGTLDTTFFTAGKRWQSLANSDIIYSLLIQTDGAFVVSGESGSFASMRVLSDGQLDTAFATLGHTIPSLVYGTSGITSLSVQTDGKIIAGGNSFLGMIKGFALARYYPDGRLDTSFAGIGYLSTTIESDTLTLNSLQLQSDAKIVGVGTHSASNFDLAMARYNTNGSLDTSFFTTGKFRIDLVGIQHAYALQIQTDGKYVTGGSRNNPDSIFSITRMETDGSLDTSFATNGWFMVYVDSNHWDQSVRALQIQTNGRILAAGYSGTMAPYDFALVRLLSGGSLDTSFQTTGKFNTDFDGDGNQGYAMQLEQDGKFVVGGYSLSANHNFALARYHSDGSLDTAFSTDGKLTTSVSSDGDLLYALSISENGKITAVGYGTGIKQDLVVVRYSSDGQLDTTFHSSGIYFASINSGTSQARAIVASPEGHLFIGGTFPTPEGVGSFGLMRFFP